jgi:hypothetical protein
MDPNDPRIKNLAARAILIDGEKAGEPRPDKPLEVNVGLNRETRQIVMKFDRTLAWFSMPTKMARQIAISLLTCAEQSEQPNPVKVDGGKPQ